VDDLVALTLETGKYGVQGMALLDKANTTAYGNPEITTVDIGVRKNPGILISGHDLKDLEMLLDQTEGTGVDVYTHSEMLPAHYYPFFKKYKNFAGNYGNAWWKQKEEFESFNGPILMTTNCIVPPLANAVYKERMFITNSQILCRINSGIRQKLSPVKIGMVLKQEGFESMRSGGKRGYRMVELTGDEIQANLYAMGRYTEKPES
jgi:hydroxylamine reductase